jgi:hypothetical protein
MGKNHLNWLCYDHRDLKTDFFICIDKYIRERHPYYKDIVTSRYYDKKSVSEISEKYQDLKTELASCLKSKGWTHKDFDVLDIAEFDYMPEVVKKETPEKYESISRFLSKNNNRAAFFVKDRYPEGLREKEQPELIKKWFGAELAPLPDPVTPVVEPAPSSAYSSSPGPMTPQTILEILGNHIHIILGKFKTEEKNRFMGFLSEISGTAESDIEEKTDNLFDFCLDFSFLAKIFRSAIADVPRSADVFSAARSADILRVEGKSPAPIAKEENQVHVLANELIRIVQDDLNDNS